MNKQSLKYIVSIVDHLITYLDGTTFDLRTQVLESDKVQVWFVIDGKKDIKMYRVDKINNTKESMIAHQYSNERKPKLETYKLEIYDESKQN